MAASAAAVGRDSVLGESVIASTYESGKSPATVTSPASLRMHPTGLLSIDIGGPNSGDGAWHYNRLIFNSPESKFAANGTLRVLLRGISGLAVSSKCAVCLRTCW